MKKVRSWKAMSSIGVMGTSRLSSERFRRLKGTPPVEWSGPGHRLEGELAEPLPLAGGDQAVERRERRVLVGAEDDRRRQAAVGRHLRAGGPDVELDQRGLLLDLLQRLVLEQGLAQHQQVALLVDVQDE